MKPHGPVLDFLTDTVALWATVAVGIATTAYLSVSITPDLWSKIVMGIFGGGLPLISVRFLIKQKMVFFWMTACLIVFSDVSMVLSLTASQSSAFTQTTKTADPALKRLQEATNDAEAVLSELLAQQREAHTKAFLDNLAAQIQTATDSRDKARATEQAWKPAESRGTVDSHAVFMAIPTAVVSGDLSRWMTLVFALMVATVYQGTVISTTAATVRHILKAEAEHRVQAPKKRKRATVKKPVEIVPVPVNEFEPEPSPGMADREVLG